MSAESAPEAGGYQGFLAVGKLGRTHGVTGEIRLIVITDFPERLKRGRQVFVGEDHQPLTIKARREHNSALLLKFEGYDSVDTASDLTNLYVYVRAEGLPRLPAGEYYHHEMVGLDVFTDEGERLGVLSQVLVTGANDVYVVLPEGRREILLPATEEVILDIDLEQNRMQVHLLPGLIPD
ncbi:MAG TPA: ribosome maturation factor RimM [Anaerolineales bacterium]|nr:ribosome maturation factor RimM [Anaerolineales bacterium]